ncbi:ankyrin repeat domain-containing protein [Fulvivirgaceae bacterium BMA12]|uniref:Ankyrin repeat domain-containing protein n=1 Tax=Agaribacillus aureus TaxID=3051825 RepID=A0ABT8L937_9BACT|nr:ankyrin repeat domain-containing protein [Fulvivirgaceae bacterium BMA12]
MKKSKKPLIEAIKSGAAQQAISLLNEHPSMAEEHTDEGISLLLLAAYYRQADIVDTILRYREHLTVFEAAACGHVKSLKEAVNKDPAVLNAHAEDGFTPLGLACFFGNEEICSFLIEAGADVNLAANNSFKVRPLHSAVATKNIKIARLLLNQGAAVNASQMAGITPLHSAAHNGQMPMVELLLAHNADRSLKTNEGKSPADLALEGGFDNISKYIEDFDDHKG